MGYKKANDWGRPPRRNTAWRQNLYLFILFLIILSMGGALFSFIYTLWHSLVLKDPL